MRLILSAAIVMLVARGNPVESESDSPKLEFHWRGKPGSVDLAAVNEYLAGKTEKLLAIKGNPTVENAKAELEQQIQYNFLRTLSILLIAGPVRVQESNKEILRLMRITLNGELDFKSVVSKLPTLLREDEATRFNMILETIQENEANELQNLRQTEGNSTTAAPTSGLQVDKIIEALGKINYWKGVSNFLKEIPAMFEGIQAIVERVQDILP